MYLLTLRLCPYFLMDGIIYKINLHLTMTPYISTTKIMVIFKRAIWYSNKDPATC